MEEIKSLTKDQLEKWLNTEEDEFKLEEFRRKYNISPESDMLYVQISRWVSEGRLKKLGRGIYRKIEKIKPIPWWDGEKRDSLKLIWPYGIDDTSEFGFTDNVEVFYGDSLVLAGRSNWGKSAFAKNFLVNNLHLFPQAVMMVNEYRPDRFREQMKLITWADFWDENKPKFDLIPVVKNHEDYILPNGLNIVDWLHISENFWQVTDRIQEMQMKLREGILLIILQKTGGKDIGIGGEWGAFLPAFYATLDPPGRLTVWKCKSWVSRNPQGRMWGYDILNKGTKFHNIREIKPCAKCRGKEGNQYCNECNGQGYTDI